MDREAERKRWEAREEWKGKFRELMTVDTRYHRSPTFNSKQASTSKSTPE